MFLPLKGIVWVFFEVRLHEVCFFYPRSMNVDPYQAACPENETELTFTRYIYQSLSQTKCQCKWTLYFTYLYRFYLFLEAFSVGCLTARWTAQNMFKI